MDNLQEIEDMVKEFGEEILSEEEAEIYSQYHRTEVDDAHYANLAETMDDGQLSRLAQDVEDWIDDDEQSREQWQLRESKGIKLLGVSEPIGGAGFEGSSKVVHPLLAEAVVQFNARSIAEMWPAEGPVKTKTVGKPTAESDQQQDRVSEYLNFLYTNEMPGAFEEEDKLLFRLPISGSVFKKTYYCPINDTFVSRMIEPSDFIVPYSSTDLLSSVRFTHRFYEQVNDIKKKINVGHYREFEPAYTGQSPDYTDNIVKHTIDGTEGRYNNEDDDQPHTMYEMYVDLILDEDKEDDIARPYIVTVDKEEQTVYRIQRNWLPDDEHKKKKLCVTHYRFIPGLGFYGYGLYHLIGGLSEAATGALRALMDSAAFANMQGGLRTRDARMPGGDKPIYPGEWREVNSSAEELKKALYPFPYKEPSQTLFNLLGFIVEAGKSFASTTENMVGEASNQAPVGTTLALIEQGSKVFSAVHKRLHEAHKQEFKVLHDLVHEYIPNEGYPYYIGEIDNRILLIDFDRRIDVIPTSDPNIISNTQRITQAQAVLELATQFPNVIDERKAVEQMLKSLRIGDIEGLMKPEQTEATPEEKEQEAKTAETQAKTEKLKAETVGANVETIYTSMQTAGVVAENVEVVPIADELAKSGGYEDKNQYPLAPVQQQLPVEPTQNDQEFPEVQQNTSPMFPPRPQDANDGMNTGIETQEIEEL